MSANLTPQQISKALFQADPMIDNFKTDLVVRVAAISHAEVLKAMGYLKPTSANPAQQNAWTKQGHNRL